MKMIDVREGKKRVERRIDRRGDTVVAEGGKRVVPDHVVLMHFTSIQRFQGFETVEIQESKASIGNRSEIAAAALDGEHAHRLARKRIRQLEFGAGVAASEIRDAEICAQEIRSVSKQGQLIGGERIRLSLVPEILQVHETDGVRHKWVRTIAEIAPAPGSTAPDRGVQRLLSETIGR